MCQTYIKMGNPPKAEKGIGRSDLAAAGFNE